ncbi:MAG: helix-turn-helix transcriptional regulator [Firmicutes bacterium]|nr:helix-turn-helix transcriptional regulator [Bacillota bacterium]
MKTRIRKIRLDNNLTQEEFASKIELSRNFISQMESGTKVPSERTIKSICREFNINYEWLVSGRGSEHKTQEDDFTECINDLLTKENPLYETIKSIIITYQKLDEKSRNVIDGFISDALSLKREQTEKLTDSVKEAEAAYIKSRSDSARSTKLSASNITDDNDEKTING